ncbi:hypothetical protein E2562_020858 [Oryza meyeriana var. granulata]|uniref:Uncharacterized protein n=1 Tax=Oryza meyeriana var. granulata TaxID=110450 RepID=A0A6G1D5X2_9ORYZ|nr:hypothetical protein E2562_020858 [Oryza meyeriana var. granulata]KAF0907774.1 hypothetical protein E2562_020858 [Oryza meyeriana var. granulata]KAF0907775.1 hypothetical protein E2562_020858 [Oryza meyeriana var. granulata]KAF0907777.1 hypothetical protein E2562_020858 [Oryza meyeriana var. granulata]
MEADKLRSLNFEMGTPTIITFVRPRRHDIGCAMACPRRPVAELMVWSKRRRLTNPTCICLSIAKYNCSTACKSSFSMQQ